MAATVISYCFPLCHNSAEDINQIKKGETNGEDEISLSTILIM